MKGNVSIFLVSLGQERFETLRVSLEMDLGIWGQDKGIFDQRGTSSNRDTSISEVARKMPTF